MIVKIHLVIALVAINGVSSASYSKVFVQKDYPVEYFEYGTPSASYSPHIARLTAALVGSVLPYSSGQYVPCIQPCSYPEQVGSVVPSANIVQYQPTSLPIVTAPAKPSGYEYSYVVYDDQTGDHKAQRELSDGTSVRGGYTFLQPDGLVREVQYVADDLQGFNAVVKNYVPIESKKDANAEKPEAVPCHEVKNDQGSEDYGSHAEPSHENLIHVEHHAEGQEQPHAEHHEADEKHDGDHEEHHESHPEHHEEHAEHHESHSEHHEEHAEHHESHPEHHEDHEGNHEGHEKPHTGHQKGLEEEEHHEAQVPVLVENTHEHTSEEVVLAEHATHISHEEPSHEEPVEITESIDETVVNVVPQVHENHHVAHAEQDNSDVLVPYNDIIRCVQSAHSGRHEISLPHKPESPLTYIILNKPC